MGERPEEFPARRPSESGTAALSGGARRRLAGGAAGRLASCHGRESSMRFIRRRSDRPDSARRRLGSSLETLETRTLLSNNVLGLFTQYSPSDLAVYNPITHRPVDYSVSASLRHNPSAQNPNLINEGKIVSGKDLAGDEWTITVHGPGYVIVTDTTPNDGVLENSIDTIQLVGTDINKTYVTGSTSTSARVQTDGTIQFNRLIDTSGVNSIVLNGFT